MFGVGNAVHGELAGRHTLSHDPNSDEAVPQRAGMMMLIPAHFHFGILPTWAVLNMYGRVVASPR